MISFFRVFLLTFCFSLCSKQEYYEVKNPALIEAAKKLPDTGQLFLDANKDSKFLYLKVDPRYITELVPLIQDSNLRSDQDSDGPHITIAEYEQSLKLPNKIPELGSIYQFKVDKLYVFYQKNHFNSEYKKWYVLTVTSPEIHALQKKYGLLPTYSRFLHISLAEKVEK